MRQLLVGGAESKLLSTSATNYNHLVGATDWQSSVYLPLKQDMISTAGTISELYVKLSAAPSAGSYTFTLMLNSVATTLTVTISSGSTTGADTSHSVNVSAGDMVSLKCAPSSASGTPSAIWSTVFTGNTACQSLLMGCVSCNKSGTYRGALVNCDETWGYYDASYFWEVIPTAGKIKNLYIWSKDNIGGGGYTVTLYVNGSASALTATVTYPATTANDTSHEVTVAAGDYVYYELVPNSPTNSVALRVGVTFVADTDGESLILGTSGDNLNATTTEYNYLSCYGGNSWSTTQRFQSAHTVFNLKKFYVKLNGSPGAGKSYSIYVRGGGGSTSLVATVSGTNTTGNDTANNYDVVNYDSIGLMSVPTSTPTARHLHWGLVSYFPSVTSPTVTTQATSSITQTTATGNGNITATGGENCTVRGICYSSVNNPPTTADSTVHEHGDFGTGAFTESLESLSPNTTYYARAYATNSAGTSYGSVDTFYTPLVVTPDKLGLSISAYAPVVKLKVVPDKLSLTIALFEPVLVVLDGSVTVTPNTASLIITTHAPLLELKVTPDALSLFITTFDPTAESNIIVTPGVLALVINTYEPYAGLFLRVYLSLLTRSTSFTLPARSLSLTLRSRSESLTLPARSASLTLPTRTVSFTLPDRETA